MQGIASAIWVRLNHYRAERFKLKRRLHSMNISRRLGTLVVFGVPAIIGGGIVYALTGQNYVSVFAYEILLIFVAIGFAGK